VDPDRHALFPPAFRAEARQVLLVCRLRGFLGAAGSREGRPGSTVCCVDGRIALCIIEQMACMQISRLPK
jgi:hypothetical protein